MIRTDEMESPDIDGGRSGGDGIGMIEIVEYQPRWVEEFRVIGARLQSALGPLALRIDHIGSTAVAGLAAKDILDLQITVAALTTDVSDTVTRMGYVHIPHIVADHCPPGDEHPPAAWSKWFFREPPGTRQTHVHVRVDGHPNQRYPLVVRDYLRTYPNAAAAYAELKRRLAAALRDPEDYPDVKDPATDLIHQAADAWATTTRWKPGPPSLTGG